MAELYDEELIGLLNAKPIEVVPEMLDYEFVAGCKSPDELRAVLKTLKSGEYGRYPDLEKATKTKLIELSPENEKRKVLTMASKPSIADAAEQKESLREWLGDVSQSSLVAGNSSTSAVRTAKSSSVPIRATLHSSMGANDTVSNKACKLPQRKQEVEAEVFRKEKLSTKEYFDRWDKYDVDAALMSDDETEAEFDQKDHSEEQEKEKDLAQARRKRELLEIEQRLAELSQAEKRFMSVKEREKGNEYFNAGENEDAICCYSKSVLLDESNAKSYANRASVYVRQSRLDLAIEDCTKAIEIDPAFVKALAKRAMCYHKMERYQDAMNDFEACHKAKGDAGYDMLSQKSKEKLWKTFHSMEIAEVNGRDNDEVADSYDYVEEIYTPGAIEAEKQQKQESTNLKAEVKSSNSKVCKKGTERLESDLSSGSDEVAPVRANAKRSETWSKISIVETSDSDEDIAQEARSSMRRIDIVEETDSEGERSPREKFFKFKDEGNNSMKHHRYGDAVRFYTLALHVDPNNPAALNNRSMAYIKLKDWEKSIADASSCLEMEPNNTKALYRRGIGKMMQRGDESSMKEALDDFRRALSFRPPEEQRLALAKKAEECDKVLSSMRASRKVGSKSTQKKQLKLRTHDTQALAF